jgi:hypothetical protein
MSSSGVLPGTECATAAATRPYATYNVCAGPVARRTWALGSARLLRWEQDGNTRAMHERSRPVPTDPVRSRVTWANDSAEQTNGRVVLAGAGLQNQWLSSTSDYDPSFSRPCATASDRCCAPTGRNRTWCACSDETTVHGTQKSTMSIWADVLTTVTAGAALGRPV